MSSDQESFAIEIHAWEQVDPILAHVTAPKDGFFVSIHVSTSPGHEISSVFSFHVQRDMLISSPLVASQLLSHTNIPVESQTNEFIESISNHASNMSSTQHELVVTYHVVDDDDIIVEDNDHDDSKMENNDYGDTDMEDYGSDDDGGDDDDEEEEEDERVLESQQSISNHASNMSSTQHESIVTNHVVDDDDIIVEDNDNDHDDSKMEDNDYFDTDDDDDDDYDEEEEEEDGVKPASKESIEKLEKVGINEGFGSMDCSVCLDELEIGLEATRMPCLHVYHTDCIVEWLGQSNMCPLCRYEMPC